MSMGEWIDAVNSIDYYPDITIIMGGEPSLHEGFVDIVNTLSKKGHNVDITSNLSFNVDNFIEKCRTLGLYIPTIWSTYHPEQSSAEEYFNKVQKLNASGIITGKITVAYMDTENYQHLTSKKYKEDINNFHRLCGQTGISAERSWIRSQDRGDAYARLFDIDGNKITRKVKCFSSWVNVAPDGEIFNCAYHMGINKNSFGNIRNIDDLRRMPEYGEYFDCDDFGWCEACHDQSGHGGFIV